MIRVTIILIALLGVAHADPGSDAKKLTHDALARFDAANTLTGKVWSLIDSSPHDNLVNAKNHVVESKADVDEAVKAGQEVDAELKVGELKTSIASLDTEIASYASYMKGTAWKLYGGIAFFIILVFGGSIWALVRRRR